MIQIHDEEALEEDNVNIDLDLVEMSEMDIDY